MSKEFENLKQIVSANIAEQELKIRTQKEEERTRVTLENIESQKRAEENMRILKESGIIGLFEEIRDSGLLKYKNEPVYKKIGAYMNTPFEKNIFYEVDDKNAKTNEYDPARIEFGFENRSVGLRFNYWYSEGGNYSSDSSGYSEILIEIGSDNQIFLKTQSDKSHCKDRSGVLEYDPIYTPIKSNNMIEVVGAEVAKYKS